MTFKLKVIKANITPHPHPPPRGGGQVLLAALDHMDNSPIHPVLVSPRA